MSIINRVLSGVPYAEKELARKASMMTGLVLTPPTIFYVMFGHRCNLKCRFCVVYSKDSPTLPEEVILRIIREAKGLSRNGFVVSLNGGEPMIYPPLYPALALAQKLGVSLGFTTNALLLTPANVRKVLSYDPFNINISLESVDPKTNEELRPFRNGTQRTLAAIEAVLNEKERTGARVGVMIKPTIMEQNYRQLPDLVRYFGKNSKAQINFQPYAGVLGTPFWVRDLANLRAVFDELLDLQRNGYSVMGNETVFDGFHRYFSNPPSDPDKMRCVDLNGRKRNCDVGLRSMQIYPNGDVRFCVSIKKTVGNVYKNSLSEIYYGRPATVERRRMVYCNIACQNTCERPVPLRVKIRAYLKMR